MGFIINNLGTLLARLGRIDWQESVLSRWDASGGLPPNPQIKDRYLCKISGNGWVINRIYEFSGTNWKEIVPSKGTAVWVEDENANYIFNGSVWSKIGTHISHGDLQGLNQDDHVQYFNQTRLDAEAELAKWNANKLQSISVEVPSAPKDQYFLQYDHTLSQFKLTQVQEQDPLSLHLDGSNSPSADISFGNHSITNLQNLLWNTDGVGTIGQSNASRPQELHVKEKISLGDGDKLFKTVQTTDETPTNIHVISTTTNKSILVEVKMLAQHVDTFEGGTWILRARIRNNGGIISIFDLGGSESKDQDSWDCDLVVSGTQVNVQVTGESLKTINWKSFIFIME